MLLPQLLLLDMSNYLIEMIEHIECGPGMFSREDNGEQFWLNHYKNIHSKLVTRYIKCLQKLYSNFHLKDKCNQAGTDTIGSVHSYTDHSDQVSSSSNFSSNNENKSELREFKLGHMKELKLEVMKDVMKEVIKDVGTKVFLKLNL